MDEGDDFNYSDLDDVAFDEEASAFPEQGFEEPQTGAVVVAALRGGLAKRWNYLPVRTRGRIGQVPEEQPAHQPRAPP